MPDNISLEQARALVEIADATTALIADSDHLAPRLVNGRLARLSIALDFACEVGISPSNATAIADEAGITADLVDRLNDKDVVTAIENILRYQARS